MIEALIVLGAVAAFAGLFWAINALDKHYQAKAWHEANVRAHLAVYGRLPDTEEFLGEFRSVRGKHRVELGDK